VDIVVSIALYKPFDRRPDHRHGRANAVMTALQPARLRVMASTGRLEAARRR
jgi:hypothetical protein